MLSVIAYGQENDTRNILYDSTKQKSVSVSLAYQLLNPTGENFIGNGYESGDGYNFNLRVYLYKNLYIGYTTGRGYLDVKNTAILGRINKSTFRENVLSLGYDFLPVTNVVLGLEAGLVGSLSILNKLPEGSNRDTGNLMNFGVDLQYEIDKGIFFYGAYNFRITKTNIKAPAQLESTFERGTYNAINFGIRFSFGDKDAWNSL